MPKAGVEPARGEAPLDFESSASTSSATSAERITLGRESNRPGLERRVPHRHNRARTKKAAGCGPREKHD